VGSPATGAQLLMLRAAPATVAAKRPASRPGVTMASVKVSWSWFPEAVMPVMAGGDRVGVRIAASTMSCAKP
ncbi:MAG: hypothetical protein ACK56I_15175, partial [bacterium]